LCGAWHRRTLSPLRISPRTGIQFGLCILALMQQSRSDSRTTWAILGVRVVRPRVGRFSCCWLGLRMAAWWFRRRRCCGSRPVMMTATWNTPTPVSGCLLSFMVTCLSSGSYLMLRSAAASIFLLLVGVSWWVGPCGDALLWPSAEGRPWSVLFLLPDGTRRCFVARRRRHDIPASQKGAFIMRRAILAVGDASLGTGMLEG
jgi:hypothetical protein